jgi:hypothetical protein
MHNDWQVSPLRAVLPDGEDIACTACATVRFTIKRMPIDPIRLKSPSRWRRIGTLKVDARLAHYTAFRFV